jgi:hypothetical protein
MIRARAALLRQAQDFFQSYLLGLYRWDETRIAAPEKNEVPEPAINARGRKRRPERPEGKFHATVEIEFGIWRLKIEGPNEHPPLGWLKLDGHGELEGPLDAAVWRLFGEHIRKQEEIEDVA